MSKTNKNDVADAQAICEAVGRPTMRFVAKTQHWHQDNEASRKLAKIPGFDSIAASAIVAIISDAREFKNGRQLAAW